MRNEMVSERWGGGFATPLLWLVAFVLIGLPLALVLVQAFVPNLFGLAGSDWTPSIAAVTRLATSPRLARGIVNTVGVGIVGAIVSTMLGAALALTMTLTDVRLRAVFSAIPWIVFATPGYFKGLAWVLLMSQGGYVVQLGLISPDTASAFFGPAGLLMVMAFALFPVPYFIIRSRLQGLGGEFLDAARMASAGSWRTVARIVVPMLMPAIGLALLTTFAEVVGDFGIANTIARSMNFGLITYNIYAATASYPVDFAGAAAQALLLAVLILGSIALARLSGTDRGARFVSGRNRVLVRFRLGLWQPLAILLLALLAFGSAGLPLLAIVARSFTTSLSAGLSVDNLSLDALRTVFDPQSTAGQSLLWSFVYAFAAAIAAVSFGLLFAYRTSLASRNVRLFAAGAAMVTVAIPGIVLAFGYILLYDRVDGFKSLPLYGSRLLLVIGYAAAALPYCLIFLWAALDRLGASLGEASRLAGATPWRHMVHIVLPLVGRAVAIAFGVTVIRSLFELPMSTFLIPHAGPALASVIVDDFTQDRDAVACALATVALAAVAVAAGLLFLIRRFVRPTLETVQP